MSSRQSVEYLLVAEFDIDKGPTISHQYPDPLASDVKQLAELMLPDQMHVRTEDWTIFFLHFAPSASRRRTLSNDSDVNVSSKDPPLMYVLNLVNTKHDKEAKRGAQVQALAIVTRHSFLHIYKPILLLALDEYGKHPTVQTLATLFAAVNSMDLSEMPKLTHTERLILLSSEGEDFFGDRSGGSGSSGIGQNGARSRSRSISTSTSSQVSHASDRLSDLLLSPISLHSPIHQQHQHQHQVLTLVRDTQHYASTIVYNGTSIPIKVPLTVLPEVVGDFSLIHLMQTFSKTHPINNGSGISQFSGTGVGGSGSGSSGNNSGFPLHPHLTTSGTNTHPIMVLFNALLSQKRVVFLGRGRPSGEVAGNVLAACAMASGGTGLLRGFTQRAFPYTDLSKIDDLLTIDGFIAGVTNSVFELHPEWWDLLCNTETGQITISPQIAPAEKLPPQVVAYFASPGDAKSQSSPAEQSDAAFINDIYASIADHASESAIRLKFRDYVFRFVRMAASYEEIVYQSSDLLPKTGHFHLHGTGWVWPNEQAKRRDLHACSARVEAWRGTDSYQSRVLDVRAQYSHASQGVRTFDLWYQVERLRSLRSLSWTESAAIYQILRREIITDAHLVELLSIAPFVIGGLAFLSQGLFHPYAETRKSVVYLLDRIREHSVGKHFFTALMRYHRSTFHRLYDELDRQEQDEDFIETEA